MKKSNKIAVFLLASTILGACAEEVTSDFTNAEADTGSEVEDLNLQEGNNAYSTEFKEEFVSKYYEADKHLENLMEGIFLYSEVETDKRREELKKLLTEEAEGVKFAVRDCKLDISISTEELEAETLLNDYVFYIEALADGLTDYYYSTDKSMYTKTLQDYLAELDYIEKKLLEITKEVSVL